MMELPKVLTQLFDDEPPSRLSGYLPKLGFYLRNVVFRFDLIVLFYFA